MVLFPNCKINLGLRITGKRADGYHEVETVFCPVTLRDALEIILPQPVKKSGQTGFELFLSGRNIPGESKDNLCQKAWELIRNDFPDLPPVQFHLLKAIPSGAGLGGGSSDAAFALRLLDKKTGLKLTREELHYYALKLGSDCPFFLVNQPCIATGRGEILSPVTLPIDHHQVVLVSPGIHISTAWAFSQVRPRENPMPLKHILSQPVEQWKEQLYNDFEQPVFEKYPQLRIIKETLYAEGASYASLTGTGSCVYGLFPASQTPDLRTLESDYEVHYVKTLS